MASVPNEGYSLAQARKLLEELEPITSQRSGDAQVKAIAAVAHSLLALTEQLAMIRHRMPGSSVREQGGG